MGGVTPWAAGPRVAFQGERGAFGEEAIALRWGSAAKPLPQPTFDAVVRAVARGDAAFGVLPLENSIAGRVRTAADALAAAAAGPGPRLSVVDEIHLAVRQCVLGFPGTALAAIATVESHPVALAQCGEFLRRHPALRAVAVEDTAGAARAVAAAGDVRRAAIAGRSAATRYGLAVLAADVQDRADNVTRFAVVARAEGEAGRW